MSETFTRIECGECGGHYYGGEETAQCAKCERTISPFVDVVPNLDEGERIAFVPTTDQPNGPLVVGYLAEDEDHDDWSFCNDCGHLWGDHKGYRCTVEGCGCDE